MRLNCELSHNCAEFPAGFISALTLNGSTLSADRVDVTAGALNITSLQDTSTFTSRQTNVGGSLSVDVATGRVSGSANYGKERQNGDFRSVETQAGITAGTSGGRSAENGSAGGGYTIDVRGNTNLTGAVIGSTADASKNTLTTGTLTTSDIQNRETYSASSLNLSGGFGFGTGRDAGGTATADPATRTQGSPGVNLGNGVSATGGLPSAMGARGGQSGTTNSAIAPGTIIIRTGADGVADAASIAVANTVSKNTAGANDGALTQQFDAAKRDEIQEAFRVTRETANQTSIFFANRAAEEALLKKRAEADVRTDAQGNAILDAGGQPIPLTQTERDTLTAQAASSRNTWGAGSPARLITTALNGAASGNAAGSLSGLVQSAAINVLQSLAVNEVKKIADELMTRTRNADGTFSYVPNAKSEAVRTALQGLTACAGAAAGGGSCSSGAMGAGASVVLNNLINAVDSGYEAPRYDAVTGALLNPLALEAQQARSNLVATIVGAVAASSGLDIASAVTAATIETENNANGEARPCGPLTGLACANNADSIVTWFDKPKSDLDRKRVDASAKQFNFDTNTLTNDQKRIIADAVYFEDFLGIPNGSIKTIEEVSGYNDIYHQLAILQQQDPITFKALYASYGQDGRKMVTGLYSNRANTTTCTLGVCVSNALPAPSQSQIIATANKDPEFRRVLMLLGNTDLGANAALLANFNAGNGHTGNFRPTGDEVKMLALISATALYQRNPSAASPVTPRVIQLGGNLNAGIIVPGAGGSGQLSGVVNFSNQNGDSGIVVTAQGAGGIGGGGFVDAGAGVQGGASNSTPQSVISWNSTRYFEVSGGAVIGGSVSGTLDDQNNWSASVAGGRVGAIAGLGAFYGRQAQIQVTLTPNAVSNIPSDVADITNRWILRPVNQYVIQPYIMPSLNDVIARQSMNRSSLTPNQNGQSVSTPILPTFRPLRPTIIMPPTPPPVPSNSGK